MKKNINIKATVFVIVLSIWPWLGLSDILVAQTENVGVDVQQTITLTKVVEVYNYEDQQGTVDQYQLKQGESVIKLLRGRGLVTSGQDVSKMLRLVRHLNPQLTRTGLDLLQVGQIINLPSTAIVTSTTTVTGLSQPQTVKIYQRTQPTQQPARVKVMRNPGRKAESPVPESVPSAPVVTAATRIAPVSKAVPVAQGSPSRNVGPLAMDPDSEVVYRTVLIRPGDTLEKLLRREGMSRDLIYGHALRITQRLNPSVADTNLILAGVELKIPAAGSYLKALADVDPQRVKDAAASLAQSERTVSVLPRPVAAVTAVTPARPVPERVSERTPEQEKIPARPVDGKITTAQSTLGLIFTHLGRRVSNRGHLTLPTATGTIELDTSNFPVVEISPDNRVVLDIGSRLSRNLTNALMSQQPPYKIFRTAPGETLDRALSRLWPLAKFYRFYNKERSYEGGTDIKLKINADWIIWPTVADWNSGRPLVINRVVREDRRTPPVWNNFLEKNGIRLLDISRNTILPAPGENPEITPESAWKIIELNPRYTTLFAAELIRGLGAVPQVGAQLSLDKSSGADKGRTVSVPLMWEVQGRKVVLEFGELPTVDMQALRQNGYRVVTVRPETEAMIEGVLDGFGLKAQDHLELKAPAGGPRMSLTIKGRAVTYKDKKFLITTNDFTPEYGAMAEPGLTVLKY